MDRQPASSSPHELPSGPEPGSLAYLQRQAGNRAVAHLIASLTVQRQLKLNAGPSVAVGTLQQQLNGAGTSARLAITGRFDTATEAAVKAFQAKQGIAPANGVVDANTQAKLDTVAPVVTRGGQQTVEVGPGNAVGVKPLPAQGSRPVANQGMKGAAVTELQQRINGSPTMSAAARKTRATVKQLLHVDGNFGPRTLDALKLFQHDTGLPESGTADPATWAKLEVVAAAKRGRVEFEWREVVEGVQNVGGRARYEWNLTKNRLLISTDIKFVPKAKGVDGRIGEWLAEIKEIWNTFQAVNKNKPTEKVKIDFEARRGGNDFTVNVWKDAKRSDAANWHTEDRRRGLASHEFGHLLGLADEYNRDEGQFVATTGQEPTVGSPAGDAAKADQLAKDIKARMPLTDDGTKLATLVSGALGGSQGGYPRFVAKRYTEIHASDVVTDIMNAFSAKSAAYSGFHGPKSIAVTPFLYSTGSIMGTMATAAVKGGHDHPVEARHVRPFVDIVTRERSLERKKAEQWEPKPR